MCCMIEKVLERRDNALSAAPEDGYTNSIILHADAQFGMVSSCLLHHSGMSILGETSSDVARLTVFTFETIYHNIII